MAAMFDLLTSQCDRHAQNIFVTESGQLALIDNESSLGVWRRTCAFDSILLPTTQKQEISRLGNSCEPPAPVVTLRQAPAHLLAGPPAMCVSRCC